MYMVKLFAICLTGALCVQQTALHAQNPTDVCLAMVTDAAHNVSLNTSSNAYYVSLYKNFCYADGTMNQAAVNSGGSAVVDAIPITGKLVANDNLSKFTNFCSNYSSIAAASGATYDSSSLVVGKTLDAVNQCMATVTGHGMSLTYKASTPNTLLINLGIPSGQSMMIHGISTDTNVKCTGSDLTNVGQSITYQTGVGQTVTANSGSTTITCIRQPLAAMGQPTGQYPAETVAVDTSVGPLNIYWPQDASVPLLTATQIQASIDAVSGQVEKLQAAIAFDALPIGTIVPWLLPNTNPPAGWAKCDGSDTNHCPDLTNMFLRGSAPSGVGGTGGSATSPAPQFGSNNNRGDGNGWSLDGNHYLSNDSPSINIIPPFMSVLYIMKIANQ